MDLENIIKLVFGVILGSGVGGGLVIDKRIVNGPNGITGEWGHNQIPSVCINGTQIKKTNLRVGEIENYVAGLGLSKAFKHKFKKIYQLIEYLKGIENMI